MMAMPASRAVLRRIVAAQRPQTLLATHARFVARPLVAMAPTQLRRTYSAAAAAAPTPAAEPPVHATLAPEPVKALTPIPADSSVKLQVRPDGVAVVRLDLKNSKVNVLSRELMGDFSIVLDHVHANPNIKAVVLISDKADGFIAGADINMLSAATSADELTEMSRAGQAMLDRIAWSKLPFVAAIHGNCLGGGLEVALACHFRVASSSPKTSLGLPEVLLGLLPGAGGTQRLPRLIGPQKALDLILKGKSVKADKARSMKLVDVLADPSALEHAAITCAQQMAAGKLEHEERRRSFLDWALEDVSYGRNFMFQQARKAVMKETMGKYPAPLAVLDVMREGLEKGVAFGLLKEADEFGRLGMTPESKGLVSLFFGQTALKKNRFGKPERSYQNIAVIGAGLMGAGIAQVSAERGLDVVLKDVNNKGLSRGLQQIYKNLDTKVKRKSLSVFDRDTTMARVIGLSDADTITPKHLAKTDMIIEAVFEDLGVKHKVLGKLEELVPSHCVIASNTSAIPIKEIAKGLKNPARVVGMHYFSPVDKMQLLEIITTDQTSKEAAAAAVEVGIKQGKTVIVVKDGPGFYTTRILSPLMAEAGGVMQEGFDVKELDTVMKRFGFPVGPATLFDEVGIDVGNHIQPTLLNAFGVRMSGGSSEMLTEMVQLGMSGRKSGKGFYMYEGKSKDINPEAVELLAKYKIAPVGSHDHSEIQKRVALRMINEAVFCLQDKTLETPVDGDIGAVFGLGFPPFTGGPFRYIDTTGASKVVDDLKRMRDIHGERFAPAPLLVDYANGNKKFHKSS